MWWRKHRCFQLRNLIRNTGRLPPKPPPNLNLIESGRSASRRTTGQRTLRAIKCTANMRTTTPLPNSSERVTLVRTLSFFAISLALFCGVALCAQDKAKPSEARIEGRIATADGEAIPGATVWLEQIVTSAAFEEKTGNDGKYSFSVAQGGSFRLKVAKDGFRDLAIDPVSLADGETKHLD